LKGRDVVLYPDAGMFDKWNKKAEALRIICKSVSVSSLIEDNASEDERKAGFDLADYLVKFPLSDFTKPEEGKQYPAYVSGDGTLYIPTPPDGESTYTVYSSVDAYNKRSELPKPVQFQSVDIAGMKQVFVNLKTLTI
jgi:hypothetical protein